MVECYLGQSADCPAGWCVVGQFAALLLPQWVGAGVDRADIRYNTIYR